MESVSLINHKSEEKSRENVSKYFNSNFESNILSLPQEVRIIIWDYFSSTERLKLRRVCETFQRDVDFEMGLKIKLHSNTFQKWQKFFLENVKIRKLHLETFMDNSLGFIPCDSSDLLELEVTESVHGHALHEIFSHYDHIETLKISGMIEGDEYMKYKLNTRICLPRLTKIVLDFCFWNALSCEKASNRLHLLRLIHAPNLTRFSYKEFTRLESQQSKSLKHLTKFLRTHLSIRHLCFTLHNPIGVFDEDMIRNIDQELGTVSKNLKLTSFQIELAGGHNDHSKVWRSFILAQDHLKVFCYSSPFTELRYYDQVIKTNFQSLTILWITTTMTNPMDFSPITSCTVLEELGIQKYGRTRSDRDRCRQDFLNFTKFPPLLKFLSLNNVKVPQECVDDILKLKSLQYLCLISLEVEDDLKLVRSILMMRTLEAVIIKKLYTINRDNQALCEDKNVEEISRLLYDHDDHTNALINIYPPDFSKWFAMGDIIGFSTTAYGMDGGSINFL